MFSLLIKAFVMFVTYFYYFKLTYTLFQHVEKVLKIVFIEIFSRQKTLHKKPTDHQLFYVPYSAWRGFQPGFPKCLKNVTFPKFQVNTLLFTKKRLKHRYFHAHIAKFLRTAFLKNIWKWLLLYNHFPEKMMINLLHATGFFLYSLKT